MKKILSFFTCLIVCIHFLNAQTPGLIVRPNPTTGVTVLDPNGDGYTSATATPPGFTPNDVTSSEIPYKVILGLIPEPTGDLLRGPSGSFSDIVKTVDGSGFYMYASGGNLYARIRMGGLISGTKGYSVLLDTDMKFGATGPDADPNYRAATTGNNGNPGFEYEIVFETNSRVAIYNVDGTSTPVLVTPSYSIASNSQISVAVSKDGGNPDYFYDFYVPYAAMGLTASSPIRAVATTVMCGCPAIGGPKSDIFGVGSGNYMQGWEDMILHQPSFTPTSLGSPTVAPLCTKPPTITTTDISPTTTTINVSWTKSSYSALTSASVQLYKDGVAFGSPINISSGGNANFSVSGLISNNIITAKAQATGESSCIESNAVKVNACNSGTHTALGAVDPAWPLCGSERGFGGTKIAGASVKIYSLTSAGYVLFASDAPIPGNAFVVGYPNGIAGTRWSYDGLNVQSGDPCGGGATDVPQGAYAMVSALAPNCPSVLTLICAKSGSAATITPTPVITSLLTDGATTISGTATGAAVSLFINDYFAQSVTVSGGTFTFTLTSPLATGQTVKIYASTDLECVGAPASSTITCYIAAPVITTDALKKIAIGSQLTGTSAAPLNTTITVYNAATLAVINTTTTAADGSWTLASPTVTSGINYLARITGSSCGNSTYSDTAKATAATTGRCGTITGPVTESDLSVSGTVTGSVANTTVTLFADGTSVGSAVISGTGWTISFPANTIYAGAVLTMTIAENGKTEMTCPLAAATQTVSCNTPATPSVTPVAPVTISSGQSVTYTIANSQSGIVYSATDNATSSDLGGSKFGTGGSMTLTTNSFSTPGNYTVDIKATSLSGQNCLSSVSRSVTVTGVVAVTLTDFYGRYEAGDAKLQWVVLNEQGIQSYEVERAINNNDFKKIGSVSALGNTTIARSYFYNDEGIKGDVIYYRLKIIENTAPGYKYSRVLTMRPAKGIVVSGVSPNPFTESVLVKFDSERSSNMILRIADMMGRPLKTQAFIGKKGMNNVILSGLQQLAAGAYIIDLSADGEKIFKQQLIKK